MSRQIFAFIVLSSLNFVVVAQTCKDTIAATTHSSDYIINNDGTVTDTQLQLIWNRCALGQRWENNTCLGDATTVEWQRANQLAKENQSKNLDQWRLPTVHELSKITELRCENPAIDLQIFPNTPSVHFWTGVEFANDTNKAWQVFFGSGENHTAKKTTKAAVRLVRPLVNN